ncbi:MAG: 16S rRNA (cytosine(1402)-N(4))-methyltransferase RsmH [Candidatus Cloacimonetes bacterium HGW-Cloacimonetes-3]|jgi:16S rRNA (cytosine1402-N4)-methyltransferase|nr:MAG: 16S rRNA (cytosine(1402)-N(4))-methyltransferase RsmH [Candidatus Cloacimonetes bacterium HGW-Cloacimonetes-3]
MSAFHTPVMAKECIDLLNLRAGKVYVDATTGGGGHSAAMLEAEPEIVLYCFDQDEQAVKVAEQVLFTKSADGKSPEKSPSVELIKANFVQMRTELALRKIKGIDGILFDLGVSSHQLDNAERGFSFEKDAPLDMRMDALQTYTAFNAVNELEVHQLAKIFKDYSDELNATRIARAIERAEKPISTTKELARIIETVAGTGTKESLKAKVRIFQALRIHVNSELEYLESAIVDAINLLNPGGRIVVLSYHSLEDRIIKQAFRLAAQDCICPASIMMCVCKHQRQLKILTKSPLCASEAETKMNPRSRSAKLRAAEKVGLGYNKGKEFKSGSKYAAKGEK